ncbi:coiled-coil domain-containing protein 181 [Brachyhypopomus gauderio]|uniref:coiled-coil domain-containing protein 181 n=1 Tax=Brachyhypopomus gauderio TaxID=698409 RepID=UPI0040410CEE
MSVSVCSNTQEEYDDDFEKDLDWLISEEESKSEEQDPDDNDVEAEIDRVLDEDEKRVEEGGETCSSRDTDPTEDRWPTPMEPVVEQFSANGDPGIVGNTLAEDNDDEEKKSLLQKIEKANRQLQDQEAPDQTRRRRLQFKDTLVDLVVPVQKCSAPYRDLEVDGEVSGQMERLKISAQENESVDMGRDVGGDGGGDGRREGAREGRVLVERDGKFDLVSLKEVESQGLLPPLPGYHSDSHHGSPRTQTEPVKSTCLSANPRSSSASPAGPESRHTPRPPPHRSQARPSSATSPLGPPGRRGGGGGKRRVQSANGAPVLSTFTLSARQKELLTNQQQQRQRIAREEEERRREEEEHKRQENELAFRAWLVKKRLQLQNEKRVQRAQQMENMSCKRECSADPDETFRLWLQKKHEQQVKEKQLEEMKRLEHESALYLHTPEERDQAFTLWLRRKRMEKRAEQQAARERSRRLVLEVRRARRMQGLLCSVRDSRTFRFDDPHDYRF